MRSYMPQGGCLQAKRIASESWTVSFSGNSAKSPSIIQDFDFLRGAGTHHHRFAHDAPHLAWFEVTEENRHPVLHLRLRDELDQAGYDGARLLLPNINLLHIERVCIRVLFGGPYVTNP